MQLELYFYFEVYIYIYISIYHSCTIKNRSYLGRQPAQTCTRPKEQVTRATQTILLTAKSRRPRVSGQHNRTHVLTVRDSL